MRWIRRLYDWVLSWAATPYGTPALALLSFAESSFFPIPPDVLQIALTLGNLRRWAFYAFVSTAASVLGGMAGYAIGHGFWHLAGELFFRHVPGFTPEVFGKVQAYYEQYNFWIVFIAAFTPIPYKVITIAAGVCNVHFLPFVLASVVGRGGRFFLVGLLLRKWGQPAREFIERRFEICTLAFGALLVGGFLVLKLLAGPR